MKINTGNFGNNGVQLGAVRTVNPEVTAMSDAEKSAAQSTLNAQSTLQRGIAASTDAKVAQAGVMGQIGKQAAAFGGELIEHAQRLARSKAEIALQDFHTTQDAQRQGLEDQLANGTIDSAGFKEGYQKISEQVPDFKIPDLTGEDRLKLDSGIASLKRQGQNAADSIYGRALHVERINAADQTVAGYSQQILAPGADIAKIKGSVDEFFNRADTKALYGTSWATKYNGANKALQQNYFNAQVEANHTDNGSLEQIRQAVMEQVDDPAARTSILNSIDSKQASNQAHADAAANRAATQSLRREVAATHADDQMQLRIAAGQIPADADWQKYEQLTAGTTVDGNAAQLKQGMVMTQQLRKLPLDQQQQVVDARKLELDHTGGTKTQYDVLNVAQRALDQQKSDLKNNPQSVASMDSGVPLQPVSVRMATEAPGEFGAQLQTRLTNSKALEQKYGTVAGKDLLDPTERADTQLALKNMTTDQRVQFWRNVGASAGPEVQRRLSTEIGGDNINTAAVATLANSPDGYRAAEAVDKGTALLNPPAGQTKAKAPKDTDIAANIQKEYPDYTPSQVQQAVTLVTAYHVGSGGNPEVAPRGDALHAVLGTPVSVMGATLTAPVGVKPEVFSSTITGAVNRLPADTSANIRNNLDRGTYSFVPDAGGNLRLINKDTNRLVTVQGKPFTVEMH